MRDEEEGWEDQIGSFVNNSDHLPRLPKMIAF